VGVREALTGTHWAETGLEAKRVVPEAGVVRRDPWAVPRNPEVLSRAAIREAGAESCQTEMAL
jgi:hypothetical protein